MLHLEIVLTDGEPRLDSRLLATHLGYEHKVVRQSIRRHKARLEAKSVMLSFDAKPSKGSFGGRPERLYLLTERQCLILSGTLKKGEEALAWHDQLVDAFLEARARVRALELQHPAPVRASLWDQRARLFHDKTTIPEGYWCIFHEVAHLYWSLEFRGAHLREEAVPDISVGLLWMKEVHRLGFDETQIRSYPHHYPDRRGIQSANIYPNAWLGTFRDWLQRVYLKDAFVKYLHRHNETPLLPPQARTHGKAGSPHHRALADTTTSQDETRKKGGPEA